MPALCLVLLLTACGASGNDDAQLGQNPGGGYFGANVNVGTVYTRVAISTIGQVTSPLDFLRKMPG